jgi:hypothetical protein
MSTPDFRHYAFVVNGVVVEIMSISDTDEWNQFHELYGSRPVIIEVPGSVENFGKGFTWDGTNFNPPTE